MPRPSVTCRCVRVAKTKASIFTRRALAAARTFDGFWNEHVEAIRPEPHEEIAPMPTKGRRSN